jgi:hypothetical protein
MHYTPIDKLVISEESYNMYGVVVDASLPYHNKENNRYIATLKVIDQNYHTRGTEAKDSYKFINCIFHAKRIEDCP